jgi:hypothetical protein
MISQFTTLERSKSLINQSELNFISKSILDYPNIETGGDLFGFWTYSGFPVIQYVIGPGERAKRRVDFFNQDEEYLKSVGKELRDNFGLQHIGEWHSHHKLGLDKPSRHDANTVVKALDTYQINRFLLVIGTIKDASSTINGFLFTKEKRLDYDSSPWVVLPGESPIRTVFDASAKSPLYIPKTETASIVDLQTVTLEEPISKKATYNPKYWMSNQNNQRALNDIMNQLEMKMDFHNIILTQNEETKMVSLIFEDANKVYGTCFPMEYPFGPPQIFESTDENTCNPIEAVLEWKNEGALVTTTVDYINQTIQILNKKNSRNSNTEEIF